jgi:hypothetical protein
VENAFFAYLFITILNAAVLLICRFVCDELSGCVGSLPFVNLNC